MIRVHTFSRSLMSIPIDRGFKPDIGFSDRTCLSLSELRELVMDRAAWHAVIHGVAKSRTRLSD